MGSYLSREDLVDLGFDSDELDDISHLKLVLYSLGISIFTFTCVYIFYENGG